jgi:hypothetical protein
MAEITEPPTSRKPDREPARPHSVLLRLGLLPLIMHFKSPKLMKQSMLDAHDTDILKKTLSLSVKDEDVR